MEQQEHLIMTKPLLATLTLAITFAISGCAMLEPQLPNADAAIPAEWPLPPNTATAAQISANEAAVIGRANVFTPVTNAHLVCRLLLEKTNLHIHHIFIKSYTNSILPLL